MTCLLVFKNYFKKVENKCFTPNFFSSYFFSVTNLFNYPLRILLKLTIFFEVKHLNLTKYIYDHVNHKIYFLYMYLFINSFIESNNSFLQLINTLFKHIIISF